jgi:hypothetical protein
MTLRVEVLEDGTLNYISDGPIVLTGPISGTVTLPDGKTINVTPEVVEVADDAEAIALSNAIGARHAAEGHPDFIKDPEADNLGFVHIPTEV